MIRRTVKFQLLAFVLISVVGITYVGFNYVGIHLTGKPFAVRLMLNQSGGIFPNADVTERGVDVGRVGSMKPLLSGGVEVTLEINHGKKIPADVHATVANLSAVGEQYVDLEPHTDQPPYLHAGSVIPAEATTVPLDDATILVDLDRLVNSVDRKHLATVIEELGKGFNDLGPSLQALIDNGNALTTAAIQSLPEQLKLINDGKTVLDTQNDVASELKSWAASFASFSDQLRSSDSDLRGVLDAGVGASKQLQGLLTDNESALPTLLGNLITVNRIEEVRLPWVKATLELYPALVASGFYVTPGDGTAHFGMVNDNSNPCTIGYSSTKIRGNNDKGTTPSDWGGPANLDAYCHGSGITSDLRGSRLVPRPPGDQSQVTNSDRYPGPVYGKTNSPTPCQQSRQISGCSPSSGASAGAPSSSAGGAGDDNLAETLIPLPYDAKTGLLTGLDGKSYQLGYSGPLAPIFGSNSWEWLLFAPTMR